MSLGISLQCTFADRFWMRACAAVVALLASATALFAQANEIREAFPQASAGRRIDPAFTPQDDLFRAPEGESSAAAETAAGQGIASDDSAAKTPIRRDPGTSLAPSGRANSLSMVWVVVFGLIAAAGGVSVWARRHPGIRGRALPDSVFQILGRQQVGPGQSVVMVRLGERVLLLSSGVEGLRTLSEINDPIEVSRLTLECQAAAATRARHVPAAVRPVPPDRAAAAAFQVVGSREDQLRAAIAPLMNSGPETLEPRDAVPLPAHGSSRLHRERNHG